MGKMDISYHAVRIKMIDSGYNLGICHKSLKMCKPLAHRFHVFDSDMKKYSWMSATNMLLGIHPALLLLVKKL